MSVYPDGNQSNFMQMSQTKCCFPSTPTLAAQSCTCVSTVGVRAFFNVKALLGSKERLLFFLFFVFTVSLERHMSPMKF